MTDENLRELERASAAGDNDARSRYRTALSRLAAQGDEEAARKLYVDVQRGGLKTDFPLPKTITLGKLPEADFGAKGRRARILDVLSKAYASGLSGSSFSYLKPIEGVFEARYLTLEQLASYSRKDLARIFGLGEVLFGTLDAILARAGLAFARSDNERIDELAEARDELTCSCGHPGTIHFHAGADRPCQACSCIVFEPRSLVLPTDQAPMANPPAPSASESALPGP
jgi:hypothetical protein